MSQHTALQRPQAQAFRPGDRASRFQARPFAPQRFRSAQAPVAVQSPAAAPPPYDLQLLRASGAFVEQFGTYEPELGSGNRVRAFMRLHLNSYHEHALPGFFSWKSTKQTAADARMEDLDTMESMIYWYLDEIKGADRGVGREVKERVHRRRRLLRDMLDELQEAHIETVSYVHDKGLKLYTPDREDLSQDEATSLDADWDSLRNQTGRIRSAAGATPRDKAELRSIHAKLLSKPGGRALLHDLLTDQGEGVRDIQVNPLARDLATAEQRRQRVGNKRRIDAWALEIRTEREDLDRAFSLLETEHGRGKVPAKILEPYQRRFLALRAEEERFSQERTRLGVATQGFDSPDPGVASKLNARVTRVNLRTGLRDSELMNEDREGNAIPAPAFVIFGHELSHAQHYNKHTEGDVTDKRYKENPHLRDWHNPEEHRTITEGENLLREEHGLTTRQWHTSKTREEVELGEEAARA